MRSSILAALFLLAVLGLTASASSAGPNAGGVLWVHDTGIVFSTDPSWSPVSTPPADCAGVDNQQNADGVDRTWKVYAAFSEGSHPQLKSTGFGIVFPEDPLHPYIVMNGDGCGGPDGAFFVSNGGFPIHPGEVWMTFSTAQHATVVELFYFTGAAFIGDTGEPGPTWCTVPLNSSSFGGPVFLDDAIFPNEDLIWGYGCLGFGVPGSTPCPQPALGCCCTIAGTSEMTTQADCTGYWAGAGVLCNPNPCLPGACCDIIQGSCSVTLEPDCTGIWLGPGVPCIECTQLGACCDFTAGVCTTALESWCHGSSEVWLGVGVSCHPNPCLIGACCNRATGRCDMTTAPLCMWDWHPEWQSCEPNPCTSACCDPVTGACVMTIQFDCVHDWRPDLLTCEPNSCPQPLGVCIDCSDGSCSMTLEADCRPTPPRFWILGGLCEPYSNPDPCGGACCVPGRCCEMMAQAACEVMGGLWHQGLPCVPNPCPQPISACCFPDGSCQMLEGGYCVCIAKGVVYYPLDVCEPNPCLPLGVCCNYILGPPADCSITTALNCQMPMEWHPDWPLVCDPDPCSPTPLTGSCCYSDGVCAVTTQPVCTLPAIWTQGAGCVPNACPQPTGSCCYPGGTCAVTAQAACAGTWHEGGACEPNPCAQPPAQGACCDHATGSCTITAQAACQFTWLGAGVPCNPTTCIPPTPVERTSWGQIKNIYR